MRIVDNIKVWGTAGECRQSGGDLFEIWRCAGRRLNGRSSQGIFAAHWRSRCLPQYDQSVRRGVRYRLWQQNSAHEPDVGRYS